ncbi:MAG: lipid-A-disaccharide synthase [Candidatus Desulfatibia sp.]|uniref:lipid-A-disaccharide synthase n=1 Tax=Candidatus Desulfatibia sp. TaxID=3101189 RepID=UPI002F2C6321
MIIAGEASGDHHGAKLVNAMQKKNNALFFCGIGGQALKNEGVRILVDASELAVVGITEVLSKITSILKGLSVAKKALKTMHPDLLVLIDFPDFNLNVAATAKKLKIPVLYYISPQVWAWRPGRVKKIGKVVNHMAVILPFEADFFKRHQIPVTFVGHPLLDKDHLTPINALERQAESNPTVGLLPGSRDREIARHLPVMLDAARILAERIKNIKFVISVAPAVGKQYVEAIIAKHKALINFEMIEGRVDEVFEKCRLVVAASGTVTLESAISGTPMVIIYKLSPISYWLGRVLIRVKHIGLVNLIAGKRVVPELLQGEASPSKIADTVFEMLNDVPGLERLRNELLSTRDMLGEPGASERVADIALNML